MRTEVSRESEGPERRGSVTQALRSLLARPSLQVMPCCFDAFSARLIERAGFPLTFMSGFAVSATRLAQPDTGLISYAEMLDQGRNICAAVSIPVIGDADTGYGNPLNVRRTIEGYAAAGFARVAELARLLSLHQLLDRDVQGLSGGERQRVALGRALAARPSVLCLDEPLSALDHQTREEIVVVLESIREQTGVIAFHVTHSQAEAGRLATRTFVIEGGALRAVDGESAR